MLIPEKTLIPEKITVTGKVTDYQGNPIFNATVVVKDSVPLKGTTTDFDGNYEIYIEPYSILEFSHVGTAQKVIKNIGLETKYNVAMMNEIQLNEVVVYGSKNFTCGWFCWALVGGITYSLFKYATKKEIKKITI